MTWQISIFSIILWVTSLLSWAGAFVAWRRLHTRASLALVSLMCFAGLWSFAQGTRIAAVDYDWQIAWLYVQWLAITFTPTVWCIFILIFIGYESKVLRRLWLFFIPSVILYGLVLANDHLQFIWKGIEAYNISGLLAYRTVRGNGFGLTVLYFYVIIGLCLIALIRTILHSNGVARQQLILVLIGLLAPLVGNILQVASVTSKLFDITPLLLIVSSIIYLWAMLGLRLLEIIPIARNTVVENLQDGVIVVDRTQRVVDMNPSAFRFLSPQWSKSTLIGQPIQTALPAWMQVMWTLMDTPTRLKQTVEGEVSGKPGFIALQLSPIYQNRSLEFTGWALMLHDVTLEQQAQAERERLREQAQAEHERLREQEMEIKLEKERIHLLSQFIQNAAHEFRTPLTAIRSSAELIDRVNDLERARKKARMIQEQVQRTTRLVDMLLKMASFDGMQTAPFMRTDVVELVESVCQQMRTRYGESPVLHWTRPAHPLPVMGMANQLLDAIGQIVDNAYRFTPPEGAITVRMVAGGGVLQVEVQDSGAGISEEDQAHIFEVFWRRDEAHSTPGFGLGLPIALRIVQMHGGRIEVESHVGQGSTFRMVLPESGASA
jgi:signal transduction histidine kinase